MRKPFDDFDAEEREMVRQTGLDRVGCPQFELLLAAEAGVLEEDEATPLRAHLSICKLCQALHSDFSIGESGAATAENLRQVRAKLDAGLPKAARPAWWSQWHLWVAVSGAAACIVILVGVRTPPAPVPHQEPVAVATVRKPVFHLPLEAPAVKLPVGSAITWRGEGENPEVDYLKELGLGLAPYRAGDYAAAVAKLRPLSRRYPKSAEAAFYLGVSLLFVDLPAEARLALEKAEALRPEALRDEVEWFMGVAWERTGNTEKAAARMEALCAAQGAFRQKACAALPRLR